MLSSKSFLLGLLVASVAAFPTGVSKRAVIAHDAVVPFAQAVPSGTTGTLMLKYKPWLKVFNGCVPFPAVDAAGNTGYAADRSLSRCYAKSYTHLTPTEAA